MRRHEIRLRHHDYHAPGIYLITMVTDRRLRSLARVHEEGVELLGCGLVVRRHLELLPGWRPQVEVVDHVVMPDHVHLLLRFLDHVPAGLGGVVNCLKGGITREINRLCGTPAAPFWQQNYWERVVRSDAELEKYRRYFRENPARWFAKYGSG